MALGDALAGNLRLGLVAATNHWSVSIGSITCPVRSPRGTISLCGFFTFHQQAPRFQSATTAFAGHEAVQAHDRRRGRRQWSLTLASSVRDADERQVVRCPTCVVVGVVRRGDL